MNRIAAIFTLALLVTALPTPTESQSAPVDLYGLALEPLVPTTVGIQPGNQIEFLLRLHDLSRDSTAAVAPVPGAPNVAPYQHQVFFDFEYGVNNIAGWSVQSPPLANTQGGDRRDVRFIVSASLLIQEPNMPIAFIAKMNQGGREYRAVVNVTVYTLGTQSFSAQVQDAGGEIKPGTIIDLEIRIFNSALIPRAFDTKVTSNPCGMLTATGNNNLIGAKTAGIVTISIRTPSDRPWYFSEICELGIQVAPSDSPMASQSLSASVIVNGGYMNPVWQFWAIGLTLAAILLFFLVKRRKERIEEEILGKPQKPWTIPVEVLYLEALRKKDERAWYVVRHHVMEEEYKSALLWYKSYKAATKGTRKKETLVLRQEKAYERWVKKWQKKIRRPIREADRFEAQLQRKLDKKAERALRKQRRKYRKLVAKLKASHASQVERAQKAWEKASAKAAKKGQPAPKRPTIAEPDYPAEPLLEPIALADHRWARKAARYRARRVRKQGNLEVKFEKADARHHENLKRTVQKLARKLDDPEFVAAHPLLQES
jgi:hypothetical protein